MPTAARRPARIARRVNAIAALARNQLKTKRGQAEFERDALIVAIGAANGRPGAPKEIRIPAERFYFPSPEQLDQHLEVTVDEDTAELVFKVVKGAEDADDDEEEHNPGRLDPKAMAGSAEVGAPGGV